MELGVEAGSVSQNKWTPIQFMDYLAKIGVEVAMVIGGGNVALDVARSALRRQQQQTIEVLRSSLLPERLSDSELQVAMVGFPAMLYTLAYEHGATYGILAVVIAIITGFAIGFLFKGGGGH